MKLKLEPKDSWTSVETLTRENPDKTGKEILELHEHSKKCYALWVKQQNQEQYDLVDRINAQPLYYKGRFGLDQRFFYKISDARLDEGKVFATVEKIVVFLGSERGVVKEGEVKIERCEKTYQDLDKYGLDMYTETTKSEWDKVGNYLTGVAKFWEDIK
ncbi:MAG: hypothetical protein AABY15_06895 [Nanoarchaeota archaeon]